MTPDEARALTLGQRVTFTQALWRKSHPRERGAAAHQVTWEPGTALAGLSQQFWETEPPYPGVLVGLRTLQNGLVEWGSYEEPTTFTGTKPIPAALVAWHLRRKPVLVRLEDLELADPPPPPVLGPEPPPAQGMLT